MPSPDAESFHADHVSEWADWLATHHERTEGVWLVRWRRGHGPQLDYDEVMLEALRFGWIDGQAKTLDETRSMLWFRQRRPGSQWSALSKDRVARVVAQARMEPAGQRVIDAAKADGSWSVLDSVEALIEPDALRAALDAEPQPGRTGIPSHRASARWASRESRSPSARRPASASSPNSSPRRRAASDPETHSGACRSRNV